MTEYNYAHFPPDLDQATFDAFANVLHAGDPAPDGTVTDAGTGTERRLSDHWKHGPVVIEFGSFT